MRGNVIPEYVIWRGMRGRCNNKTNSAYKNYGAKGVRVCKRWDCFSAFLSDMGRRPTPKHTIDRINSKGGYSPKNCRWASRVEQIRNRSCALNISFAGINQPLSEWAREAGLGYGTLKRRIFYLGWPLDEAILTPAGRWMRG